LITLLDAPYIFQIGGIAAAVTLLLALPGIWIARQLALIDWPGRSEHKQHARPVPLAGGIIIALSVLAISPFLGLWSTPAMRGILLGGLVVMLFGAWDDWKVLPAWAKLAGQLIASIIVIASGTSVHFIARLAPFDMNFFVLKWIDWIITIFWLVGITNAFNLIDSMDGLVVGTSGVALCFFLLATFEAEQITLVRLTTLLLGVCAGLYVYNVAPASLFLGDSGAQMLGFFMACIGILYSPPNYPQGSSWFIPILLLGVPIFDTTLVVFSRLRRRKPIYQGDLSHTYHRLVLLGLETKKAVVVMHLAGIFLGCLAFVALSLPPWAANLTFGLILLAGILIMIFLDRVVGRKNQPVN
jgi:UDP-GlcNAc:undecaprenyl-phosphate GlcNAc-1-phosphate transferase